MEIIAWALAGFFFVVSLALARRVIKQEEDLRIERQLCDKAEETTEKLREEVRRLTQQRLLYFAGQPTLDATAYRAEKQPLVVWWTYDN